MGPSVVAAVAIGSNDGARESHIQYASLRLASILSNLRVSSVIETEPVDVPGPQRLFLNAAAVGETSLTPRQLLASLAEIERERDRRRPFTGAPRTLDLDLILLGDHVIDEPDLCVPHPRFRVRRFVLEPLFEIAPDLHDPVTGKTIGQLLADVTLRS